jgi:hypothetical protein
MIARYSASPSGLARLSPITVCRDRCTSATCFQSPHGVRLFTIVRLVRWPAFGFFLGRDVFHARADVERRPDPD